MYSEKVVNMYITVKNLDALPYDMRAGYVRRTLEKIDESLKGMGCVYSDDAWETEEYKLSVHPDLHEDVALYLRELRQQLGSRKQQDFGYLEIPMLLEIIDELRRR